MKKSAQIIVLATVIPFLGSVHSFAQQGGRSSRQMGNRNGSGSSYSSSAQARAGRAGAQRNNSGMQQTGEISDVLIPELLFLREEEKLARDVYLTLGQAWNHPVFASIARSEQMHMDSVLSLLTRYGITDPVGDNAVGQFTDPDLQAVYMTLVDQGMQSLTAALRVGATIEDMDIQDLVELSGVGLSADVARVVNNLLNGSKNHLRAFVGALEYYGETYTPQFMDPELYAQILSSENTRGNRTGQGQGQGQASGQSRGRSSSSFGQRSSGQQSSMQGAGGRNSSSSGNGGQSRRGGSSGNGKGRR